MTYAYPACQFAADTRLLKLQRLQIQGTSHYWQSSKVHIDTRITCDFQNSVSIRFYYEIMQAASRSPTKSRQ